jgi:hypothetical protein
MSGKIKARQDRVPKRRNLIVKDMLTRGGGGMHKDRRDKRNRRANEWRRDLDFDA